MSQGEGTEGLQVITSVTGHTDGMQVATVTTDNGEVLHIQQSDQNTE
jgi:alpha-D-ribose 1-methylphosphonate 5-phosphate C-P lyase